MKITADGATDIGRQKAHNEDAFTICEEVQLYLVCDGVGGLSAGDVASKMACQSIVAEIKKNDSPINNYKKEMSLENRDLLIDHISSAISIASHKIWKFSQHENNKNQMATTLVMALIINDNAFIAHVGDSRLYLFRKNEGFLMTEDHSYVNELIKHGVLAEEKAKNHPQAKVITRALGFQELVKIDTLHIELEKADRLLLCSDGLHHYFEMQDLQNLIQNSDNKKFNAEAIALANKKGGHDNITSLLITFGDPSETQQNSEVSQKIATLKKLDLFKTLSFKELSKVLEIIKVKSFPEKKLILHEGDMGDEMFIILTGSVDVLIANKKIKTIQKGSFFGEMALVDKEIRSASIIANENTRTLIIQRTELLQLFRKENPIGLKMMWAMLQTANIRIRQNDQRLHR